MILARHAIQHKGKLLEMFIEGRGGTKSPVSIFYRYEGRTISKYEMVKRNWENLHFNFALKYFYNGDLVRELIYGDNPFYKAVTA